MFTSITEYFLDRRPLLTDEAQAEARDHQEGIILVSTLALDIILLAGVITLATVGCTGMLPLPVGITFAVLSPLQFILYVKILWTIADSAVAS